jgi:hypothetical protein
MRIDPSRADLDAQTSLFGLRRDAGKPEQGVNYTVAACYASICGRAYRLVLSLLAMNGDIVPHKL